MDKHDARFSVRTDAAFYKRVADIAHSKERTITWQVMDYIKKGVAQDEKRIARQRLARRKNA